MGTKLESRYCYDSSDQYMEYYDRIEVDAKLAEVAEVLKGALRCMEGAKRRWAPTTTNSDADDCIKRIRECLGFQ